MYKSKFNVINSLDSTTKQDTAKNNANSPIKVHIIQYVMLNTYTITMVLA